MVPADRYRAISTKALKDGWPHCLHRAGVELVGPFQLVAVRERIGVSFIHADVVARTKKGPVDVVRITLSLGEWEELPTVESVVEASSHV